MAITVLQDIDSSGKKYFATVDTSEAENGVPTGGATGQVLAKASATDYDTEWVTPEGGDVDSVNGQTGVVVLDTDDIGEGTTNKYLSATQKTDLTDGGTTTLHTHSHTILTDIGTNTHAQIDTKLASLYNEREIKKETTGFTNCENINVSYNATTRKVTLTGTFQAYYKGELVSALTNGWESPAHADVAGTYFLHYCENGITFTTEPWTFDCLQIAFIQYNSHDIAIREVHGFMQWQSHKEFHETIGTYKTGGGTFSSYVLNSTTVANRRVDISDTTVRDEDLTTTISALTTKQYTHRYLSGAGIRSLTTLQNDIIALNGNIPYWNEFNGSNWVQTPMSNNQYGAIFVVAIPTTSDTNSQLYRYMFVQPQKVGTLTEIEVLTPNDLTHGDSSLLVSEFVFFAKIIIGVSGNNWTITSIQDITGTRLNQTASTSGNFLASVNHDTTLTGDGTSTNPLSAVEQKPTIYEVSSYAEFKVALEDTSQSVKNIFINTNLFNISANETITVSGTNNVFNNCIFSGNYTLTLSGTGTTNIYNKLYFEGSQISVNGALYINILQIGTYTMFIGTGIRKYQYVMDIDTIEGISQQDWIAYSSQFALKSNVLQLNNTTVFTPDQDYEPATKLYVDSRTTGKTINTIYEVNSITSFEIACEDTSQSVKNIVVNGILYLTGNKTIEPYGDINILTPAMLYSNGYQLTFDGTSYRNLFASSPVMSFLYNLTFVGNGNLNLVKMAMRFGSIDLGGIYSLNATLDGLDSSFYYQYWDGTGSINGNGATRFGQLNWNGLILPKAIGTDVITGTNDIKYITPKAMKDSGLPDAGGWSSVPGIVAYGSADSPTFYVNTEQDLRGIVGKGDKIKLTQAQALTGYWSFDTNSSPDVGSFTMANIGTPTYTAGKFGNALTLNGTNQALSITDAALLKPTGAFTIGCWFKTSTTGTTKTLFQSWSDNTNANGIILDIGAINVIALYIGNNAPGASTALIGTTVVTDNQWHYVVATFNNNYAQVYLDGNLEMATYAVTPTYAATNYVRIGCENNTGTNTAFMNGQIDDLFLINGYALDEKTIRDKYELGTAQGTGSINIDKIFLVHANPTISTLTLYGGTDFQLANSTISNVYYSKVKNPQGYNGNCDKWSLMSVYSSNVSQANPTGSTWYNLSSALIPIHIGMWDTSYSVLIAATRATAAGCNCYTTLSTANNTESDAEFTRGIDANPVVQIGYQSVYANKRIATNVKMNMYLNTRTTQAPITGIYNGGAIQKTVIKATSIYC